MIEIRDSSGNVVGYFSPPEEPEEKLYERAAALVDVEEMERRAATEQHGHSIEEVRRHLTASKGMRPCPRQSGN